MDRERWERIEELFHAASPLQARERDRFLAGQCPGDDSLRREVEDLLSQRSTGFPAVPGDRATPIPTMPPKV